MPIFFQQEIDIDTKLAVWRIEEDEAFFRQYVPLQREISHSHKRRQHLAGRFLLQYLFPDFPINLIQIADTRKPFLEDEAYHFSISHCGVYAAAIVSRTKRVGVDIEVPTDKVRKIAHKFLHDEERGWVEGKAGGSLDKDAEDGAAEQSSVELLTLLWSCKEAVFKWWSYGNVDFSEMIRLAPFPLQSEGLVQGHFHHAETHALALHYKRFTGLSLAWLSQ